jgi:4-amino-4-deoxy-L-arabinose transferase-like glycosyltransferase
LGLAARVAYTLAVAKSAPLVGDAVEIRGIALAVADGHGYVNPFPPAMATAHKPPLYPLALALVSVTGLRSPSAHQIASALIGAGTVVVVALVARRLAGDRAALIAAALGAIYPVFIATDASLRTECLYLFLIALALLAALRAWESPSVARMAQLGAVVGLAALTRSEGLLLLLLALPIVWRVGRSSRAVRLGVAAAACLVVMGPWLIRCWIVFDEPVLISTNYGDLVAGANCDATYSGRLIGEWAFECALGETGSNEAVVAKRLRSRGLHYARDHAGRLPAVLAVRALRPWGFYSPSGEIALHDLGEGRDETTSWLGLAMSWVLLALAIPAFVLLVRRGKPWFVVAAPFLLVVFVSVTAYGSLRFRAPADVALVVLGAVALDAAWARLQPRGSAGSATS